MCIINQNRENLFRSCRNLLAAGCKSSKIVKSGRNFGERNTKPFLNIILSDSRPLSSRILILLNQSLLLSPVKLSHNSHMVVPPGLFNSLGTCSPNADLFGDPCSRSLISVSQRQEPINYRLSKFSSSRHRKLQPLRES